VLSHTENRKKTGEKKAPSTFRAVGFHLRIRGGSEGGRGGRLRSSLSLLRTQENIGGMETKKGGKGKRGEALLLPAVSNTSSVNR